MASEAPSALAVGARWLTLSTFVVGVINYAYSFALTRLLAPEEYAIFAAGQALLLTAGTVAVSSIPWILAKQLASTTLDRTGRQRIVKFALLINTVQGTVAGFILYVIGQSFADSTSSLVLAISAFSIFVASTAGGWLQGTQRFGLLASTKVLEPAVKIASGLSLIGLGAGAAGALGGFGLGSAAIVVTGFVLMRSDIGPLFRSWSVTGLAVWRDIFGVASIQGLVSVLASVDVVLVAVLATSPSEAASYQASMILSRIPLFLGGAIAIVAFPLIAKRQLREGALLDVSVQLYLRIAVPFACVVATLPLSVISLLFPAGFDRVADVLPYTAASGFLIGLIELVSTFYQARAVYRPALLRQSLGLVVSLVAVPLGWHWAGLTGIASGAMIGAASSVLLLLIDCRRRWRVSLLPLGSFWIFGAAVVAALSISRTSPLLWVGLSTVLLAVQTYRVFFRKSIAVAPDAPARSPRPDGSPTDQGNAMRILHLGFEDHRREGSGGGSLRNREVNRRLADRHAITVLTTNYNGATERVEDGVRYVPIGLPIGYFPSLMSYFAVLPFAARKYQADLVVEEFAAPLSSILMPLWTQRPTLALVQWLNAKEKSRQYKLPFFIFEWLGLRCYNRFVTVSEDMRAKILDSRPKAHVDVIANGVDRDIFDYDFQTGEDVLFMGRLETAQKGIDLLLQAYAQVAPQLRGRLLIAGVGPDQERLHTLVDSLQIRDRVVFVGRVDGEVKHRLLGEARVVAMPSRFETFGIVAVEALASGTPVIAFDIPCLRAVIPDDCGVLVPAFEVSRFAAELLSLYSDTERVAAMGEQGRIFARQFDWDSIALDQERAYFNALEASRGAR
ncbi:glycosyltransferase involved in cell wall bisynthesis [Jatrophihabitans sp. GAS493]|uniref:glycosyltransferase n=1 Tax=Jatrophihabitans sp. GAS493 TaxID=1907575 RepID=UPI000BB72FC3|nr:glycosyltransferase [Jatrophihabitans sp. GAS493]SOD71514.1 glycosyltransferase involved in cell wall bisynthesis [Jatrophihabitans sp. GAS493]